MKKPDLVKATEKVVALKMRAIDRIIEDLVEPLEDVGNPEKLIGKKFSDWNEGDLTLLTKIYGTSNSSPLSNLVFRRKYEEVLALEAAEL